MSSDTQRLMRWVIIAVVVAVAGVLSYNFLARERAREPAAATPPPTAAPAAGSAPRP